MPGKTKNLVDEMKVATFSGKAVSALSKEQMKNKSVLVCLSITGNLHCVGAELQAIVKQALLNYKEATFLIGDETHWHNLKTKAIVTDEEQAHLKEQAINLGSIYLQQNLPCFLNALKELRPQEVNIEAFNAENAGKSSSELVLAVNRLATTLGAPFKIVRWHDWVANTAHQYAAKQADTIRLYQTVDVLKDCLELSTADFVRRHKHQISEENLTLFTQRSRDYLNEETPAIFCIAAALRINFVAYPGKMVKLFQATRDFFITHDSVVDHRDLRIRVSNPDELANWLEIKIKTKALDKTHTAQIDLPVKPSISRSRSCDVEWLRGNLMAGLSGGRSAFIPIHPRQPLSLVGQGFFQRQEKKARTSLPQEINVDDAVNLLNNTMRVLTNNYIPKEESEKLVCTLIMWTYNLTQQRPEIPAQAVTCP